MSSLDTNKPYENTVSEKQFNGYWVPNHNAKIIKESIDHNAAPFLPDQSGNIKAMPIYNGNTGYCLNAKDLIPLQIIRKDNNSNFVATYKTITSAGTSVKTNEKGFFYNYQREDKTVGTAQFFFPDQTDNPDVLTKAAEAKIEKHNGKKIDKTIEIKSAEPTEYLANYVAACRTGTQLKVALNISEQFKKDFSLILDNQISKSTDRNKDMDTLGQFMFKVDLKANEITKQLHSEINHNQQHSPENKREQEISF